MVSRTEGEEVLRCHGSRLAKLGGGGVGGGSGGGRWGVGRLRRRCAIEEELEAERVRLEEDFAKARVARDC
eukprot:915815-Pleurochrysis_carterae.AAC.8